MRTRVIAGNWKMNKDLSEAVDLMTSLSGKFTTVPPGVRVILCPPFPWLPLAANIQKGAHWKLGAQNMSQFDDGAYTGEISWRMLRSSGCEYVILGHSERRQIFGETNDLINVKTRKALTNGLIPIVCVGETLAEREANATREIIGMQVKGVLAGITSSEVVKLVLAYEPVWAIGTGRNATPLQAEEIHQFIRKLLGQMYDWKTAEAVSILYGGSVKADNAGALLAQSNIDGALVGGACLDAASFAGIVNAAMA